jgi:hypothetical protein
MTNLTTAAGFATFIITIANYWKSLVSYPSLSIVPILLCLIIIPIYYSYQPVPQEKHLRHLSRNYTKVFMAWLKNG